MQPAPLLALFDEVVTEVSDALSNLDDWGPSGGKPGQYVHDVVADELVVRRLRGERLGVLTEESGLVERGDITVVVDPVDGSTNASRGLPWYAISLCAVDDQGPLVSSVVNLASGDAFRAIRGEGAEATPGDIEPTGCRSLNDALLVFSGLPPDHGGWRQFRSYGAAALDICGVATGLFDGFMDVNHAHGVWDYLGSVLFCQEAGIAVAEVLGRELCVLDPELKRGPVVAATDELLAELLGMYQEWQTLRSA